MKTNTKPTIGTTTTEAKIERILEHEHSRSFCKREIMQLIAQEKKALLEEVLKIILVDQQDFEASTDKPDSNNWRLFYQEQLRSKQLRLFEALAHSQEDREGKEDNENNVHL